MSINLDPTQNSVETLRVAHNIQDTVRLGLDSAPRLLEPTGVMQPSTRASAGDRAFDLQARAEQHVLSGIVAGSLAALSGAVLWAVISVVTNRQYGIMAVGVGILVGWAVRRFGNGVDLIFGVAGAAFSLLGIIVGNLLMIAAFVSQEYSTSIVQVLVVMTLYPDTAISALAETFAPVDLVFYGVALYYGFRASFRKVLDESPRTKSAFDRH